MPADLTVVWNPASDSILSRQIIAALDQWKSKDTRPMFVSVTSTADWATGTAFPVAMNISAVTKRFTKVGDPGTSEVESERNYYTSTPGHKKELINRDTVPVEVPFRLPPSVSAVTLNLSHNLTGDTVALPSDSGGIELWNLRHHIGAPDVPYWDIQVDQRIIKNHGDVWNPKAEALLAGLFRIANPLNPAHGRPEATFATRDFRRGSYNQQSSGPEPSPVR